MQCSGLSAFVGVQLEGLGALSPAGVAFISSVVVTIITQVVSNTATTTLFLPILAELVSIYYVLHTHAHTHTRAHTHARTHTHTHTNLTLPSAQAIRVNINPLYLMIPATVSASLAFVLPVATPPNAIAFSYGIIKVYEMVSIQCIHILTVYSK